MLCPSRQVISATLRQLFDLLLTLSSGNLPAPKLVNAAGNDYLSSVTQIPTLTCFIASLEPGRTFRVSMHSWEKPKPSTLLLNLKPEAGRIVFEAKLCIDGQIKAQRLLGEHNIWPEVIGTWQELIYENIVLMLLDSEDAPTRDYPRELRFPSFHSEILQQSHWDARDGLGRIRIVIAEGISHSNVSNSTQGFHKLRDVVAFSFQHAPRNVLEYSGIAWPNARMFQKPSAHGARTDFEAHAHSPQRSTKQHASKAVPGAIELHAAGPLPEKFVSMSEDPFVGPRHTIAVQQSRKPSTDIAFFDFARNKNQSEMSGVVMQQLDFQQQMDRAAVDEIVRALTPMKRFALLDALSPSKHTKTVPHGSTVDPAQPALYNRVLSSRTFAPSMRQRSASGETHRSSTGNQRSTSGHSTVMSWDETPALGDLWSNASTDFPGLLPSLQSSEKGNRSGSAGSKRKRSVSPRSLLQSSDSNMDINTKGMSTSPCKRTPTPRELHRAEFRDDESNYEKQAGSTTTERD